MACCVRCVATPVVRKARTGFMDDGLPSRVVDKHQQACNVDRP